MIELQTIKKPPESPLEGAEGAIVAPREVTKGAIGAATGEKSRSMEYLVAKGKSGPIRPPFESVIGRDERVRILDTDLYPWSAICALRMRGPSGGAMGTGWFIGPRTVITAGHCVY